MKIHSSLSLALTLTVAFSSIATAQAQDSDTVESTDPPPSLSQLAKAADLIALVRVLDTDYQYTREFPSGGSAFLEVLLPYKVSRPLEEIVQVYEEGLHSGECYFDNPSVLEEGRRHLVFLKFSPDVQDQYNGLEPGCKLDVLVTEDNRYVLRYPVDGIELSDKLAGLAIEMAFQDANAYVGEEEMTPPERNRLLELGYLEPAGELRYRYTRGIPLLAIRELLGPEGLTLDRSIK